jgi:hypothetical protein
MYVSVINSAMTQDLCVSKAIRCRLYVNGYTAAQTVTSYVLRINWEYPKHSISGSHSKCEVFRYDIAGRWKAYLVIRGKLWQEDGDSCMQRSITPLLLLTRHILNEMRRSGHESDGIWWGNLKLGEHLENIRVGRGVVLKLSLGEQYWKVWMRFIWY